MALENDHDQLTRVTERVDAMQKNVDARFVTAHDRANEMQKAYFEWEKRLRLAEDSIKELRTTAKINWAWWAAISAAFGVASSFLFQKPK